MAQAFIGGAVDAICAAKPYAMQTVAARKGASVLSDGSDLYGPQYADCVLALRSPMLDKQPEALGSIIKALLTAQQQIETDRAGALKDAAATTKPRWPHSTSR